MTCSESVESGFDQSIDSIDAPADERCLASPQPPTVVIVSADPIVRNRMSGILKCMSFNVILASGLREFKAALEDENLVACLCGYRLTNGGPHEVVDQARQQPIEIPVVMVSAPENACDYEMFLDSLSIGAFDFICHPYRLGEVQNIVRYAIQFHEELARTQSLQKRNSTSMNSTPFESQFVCLADNSQEA